jgi:hypothetical protein
MSWPFVPLLIWLAAFVAGLALCLFWPVETVFGSLRKRNLRKWLWAWSLVVALSWLLFTQLTAVFVR